MLLGALMASVLALQTFGLHTVSTSEGSFLSNTTTGMVPLMTIAVTRRLPKPAVAAGSALVLAGIYVLTGMNATSLAPGALMYLASAALYGMLFGLGPLFSTLLGVLVLGETFDACDMAGAALILTGVTTVVLNDREGIRNDECSL